MRRSAAHASVIDHKNIFLIRIKSTRYIISTDKCAIDGCEMENQKISKTEISDIYIKVLSDLGYKCELDEDGDVDFNIKGLSLDFCAVIDGDQAEFIRVCCFGFYRPQSESEKNNVYKACNFSNIKTKVAKTYLNHIDNTVWAAYEAMIPEFDESSLLESISSAIPLINQAIKSFVAALEEKA